ncbi:hypothetical protein ATE47_03705 [Chryseobacterium sp. IHB B 17019]|nr:hypothetical protein ATE47_03705 [Chryseobacterium sp. IHB B 17019]
MNLVKSESNKVKVPYLKYTNKNLSMINKYIDLVKNTEKKEKEALLRKSSEDPFVTVKSKLASYLLQIEMRSSGLFCCEKYPDSLPGTDYYQLKIITLEEKEYKLSVQSYYKGKKIYVYIKLSKNNNTESVSRDLPMSVFMKTNFEKHLISLLKQLDDPEKKPEYRAKENSLNPIKWLNTLIKKYISTPKEI